MQNIQQVLASPLAMLRQRFSSIRRQTEKICEPLQSEDYVVQPVLYVSPPKWHLGHTSWFFEQFVLLRQKKDYQVFHPEYAYLFNSYYETVGERVLRTNRGNLTRPSVQEVYQYRQYVNSQIDEYLQQQEVPEEIQDIIELGLQHEQQHQELLLYDIKYILGGNPLFPAYTAKEKWGRQDNNNPAAAGWLLIDEGMYQIGFSPSLSEQAGSEGSGAFCYDNELGQHHVYLHKSRIMSRLVTNEEYLEFMEAGAYTNFRYWLQEGWEWVRQEGVTAPFYWFRQDGEWYRYSLHGREKVNLQAPVTHVSFYEADAYARWRGMRLPTEQEWEVACKKYSPEVPEAANLQDTAHYEPMPLQGQHYQFYGDVWEWTSSPYIPYPYYKAADGALGEYNGKFMVNQMVLRGGSCATPRAHIRPTYRNFFHPHLRWMYSGIRLAQYI